MWGNFWKVQQCAHPRRLLELGRQRRRLQSRQRFARQRQQQRRGPLTQKLHAWTTSTALAGGQFLVEILLGVPQKRGVKPNREPRRGLRVPAWNEAAIPNSRD